MEIEELLTPNAKAILFVHPALRLRQDADPASFSSYSRRNHHAAQN